MTGLTITLNLAKAHFTKFMSKCNDQLELDVDYDNKLISATTSTRFLGLTINCSLTWTNHIDLLTKN
jgi:hypothetical protein